MPTYLPLAVLLVTFSIGSGQAFAQVAPRLPRPLATPAAIGDGWVSGIVRDEHGAALGGAAVVATGAIVALAESDSRGQFSLVLPVGDYLIRVVRDGYLTTYREPVRVEPNRGIERRITLTRLDLSHAPPEAAAQPAASVEAPVAEEPAESPRGRSEMAWRLRHLRRTVLRDVGPAAALEDEGDPAFADRLTVGPLVDGLLARSARAAGSFLADTDFTGHINLLMSGAVPVVARPVPGGWSHGVADVFLGAPVGSSGDWSIRGAMAAGDRSSWTLVGEYQARADQPHEVRLAVSYATQGFLATPDLAAAFGLPESRSAGGIDVTDSWHVRSRLTLDYGVRLDWYDYLTDPNLISPHAGVRVGVVAGTMAHASTSRRMGAPGAAEFVPPSASGPWLPPARTFVPLAADDAVLPTQVDRHAVGVDQFIGSTGTTIGVEWFSESTENQTATLFGLDRPDDVGHYYVATVGSVAVTGWRVRAGGGMSRHVRARVEYAEGRALWQGTHAARALKALEPSVARSGREAVSDLRTTVDITVPATATDVVLGYQVNRVTPVGESPMLRTLVGRGLDLALRQRLPYQPLDAGFLNALFTLTTLLHGREAGSLYDEILAVRAPARVTAGLQLGF